MGKQDAEDDRNQLLLQFVRVVEELKPRAFCMENVPGLLDSRFDFIREEAFRRLREAGYAISGDAEVLKAEEYGVPQKRRRVVVLGTRLGIAPSRPRSMSTSTFNVVDAFFGLPDVVEVAHRIRGDELALTTDERRLRESLSNEYLQVGGILAAGDMDFGHRRVLDPSTLSGNRLTEHTSESVQRFANTQPGKKEPISRLYRLALDAPALTLRAGTGRERGAFSAARPLHPESPRVHTTNWHGHRQIGNAVPPLLARAAATSILDAFGARPAKSGLSPIRLDSPFLLSLSPTKAAEYFNTDMDQVPQRKRDSDPVELAA
jgi:DNA (cytosine-5)-methyltransferase 1